MRQKTQQERCGSPYLLDDILALLTLMEHAPPLSSPLIFHLLCERFPFASSS